MIRFLYITVRTPRDRLFGLWTLVKKELKPCDFLFSIWRLLFLALSPRFSLLGARFPTLNHVTSVRHLG